MLSRHQVLRVQVMVTGMERPRTCSYPWELSFTVLNSLPANSIVSRKVLLTAFPRDCISICWGGVSLPNLSFLSYHWALVWTLPVCLSVSDLGQEPCVSLFLGPSTWSTCLDSRQSGQVASCDWHTESTSAVCLLCQVLCWPLTSSVRECESDDHVMTGYTCCWNQDESRAC